VADRIKATKQRRQGDVRPFFALVAVVSLIWLIQAPSRTAFRFLPVLVVSGGQYCRCSAVFLTYGLARTRTGPLRIGSEGIGNNAGHVPFPGARVEGEGRI
jgi:hypothetical protein